MYDKKHQILTYETPEQTIFFIALNYFSFKSS